MVLSSHLAHSNIIANSDGNLNWQDENYLLSDDLKIARFAAIIVASATKIFSYSFLRDFQLLNNLRKIFENQLTRLCVIPAHRTISSVYSDVDPIDRRFGPDLLKKKVHTSLSFYLRCVAMHERLQC